MIKAINFLLLIVLLIKAIYSSSLESVEIATSKFAIGTISTLNFKIKHTGNSLDKSFKFIFNTLFPLQQNTKHECCYQESSSKCNVAEMHCASNNNAEENQWIITVNANNAIQRSEISLIISTILFPNAPKSILIRTELSIDGVPVTYTLPSDLTIVNLENIALPKVVFSNPINRANSDWHYSLKLNTIINYHLDIMLEFPTYMFENKTVSVINQINYPEKGEESEFSLKNVVGLSPDATLVKINDKKYIIINAFKNGIVRDQQASFTLTNLVVPDVINKSGFKFNFVDQSKEIIIKNSYTLSCPQIGQIKVSSVIMGNTRVNGNSTLTITFTTFRKIPFNSVFQIIRLNEISFYKDNIICIKNCKSNPTVIDKDGWHYLRETQAKIYEINNLLDETLEESTTTEFLIDFLIVPYKIAPIELQFAIIDNQKDLICIQSEYYTITPEYTWYDIISIVPQSNIIGSKGNLFFTIRNNVVSESQSRMEITFSSDYEVDNMTSQQCIDSLFSAKTKCEINNNVMVISNFGLILNGKEIKFTIPNMRNPKAVKDSFFTLKAFNSNNTLFILNDNLKYDLVPSSFKAIICNSDNQQNDALSNYNFKLELSVPIGINGKFEIIFPKEFALNSENVCNDGFECIIDDQKITITKPETNIDEVSFTILKMKNLRSFQTSMPIEINSYNADGFVVDQGSVTIRNTIPLELGNTSIIPSDLTSNKATPYNVEMTIKGTVYKGDKIHMIIPEDIQLVNESVDIKGKGSLIPIMFNSITNNPDGNGHLLIITIDLKEDIEMILKDNKITFTIDGLINPLSTKPSAPFEIEILTNENNLLMKLTETITITVNPNALFIAAIYPKEHLSLIYSDFIVYFKPNIPLKTFDKIIIEYPKEVTLITNSCIQSNKAIQSIQVEHEDSQKRIIIQVIMNSLRQASSSDELALFTFEFPDMKASIPVDQVETSSFKIYTTTSEGHKIDQYPNSLTISSICYYPCETCQEDSSIICTSCLPNSIDIILIEGICYSDCPDNYSLNPETGKCIKCDDSCKKCSYTDITQCTKCFESLPYLNNAQCFNECPSNMYSKEDKICLKCSDNCDSCINSSDECISCSTINDFAYLYNKQCLKQCPQNTIEKNKECIDCDSSCKTCINAPSSCTSCSFPFFLLNKVCVDISDCKSEDNYYPNNANRICEKCQEGCIMCGNGVDKCMKCNSQYFLKDSICILKAESCFDGFYLTTDEICEKCNIETCSLCQTTPTTCTQCYEGLLLHDSECLVNCPLNYFKFESSCVIECPDGYIKDNQSLICIQNSLLIVPFQRNNLKYDYNYQVSKDYFIFLIFSLLTMILCGIIKIINRNTIYFACLIPFISLFSNFSLILLFIYSFYSGEISYFYPIAIIFTLEKLLNNAFMIVYAHLICIDKDIIKWNQRNKCSYLSSYIFMHLIDYKILRLNYSCLFNSQRFHIECSSYKNIQQPYKIASYVDITLVCIPVMSMCIYIISSYKKYSFLYYLAIENSIIFVLLTILMLCDMFINKNWDSFLIQSKKSKVIVAIPPLKIKETNSIKDEDKKIEYSIVADTKNTKTTIQPLDSPSKNSARDFSDRDLYPIRQKTLENVSNEEAQNKQDEASEKSKKIIKENDRYNNESLENQNTDRDNVENSIEKKKQEKKPIENNFEKQSLSTNHNIIIGKHKIISKQVVSPTLRKKIIFPSGNTKQISAIPISLGDIRISAQSNNNNIFYDDSTINNNNDSS